MTPIRASDGTLLTEKAHILERWTAHFSQLLNKTSSVEDQAIQDMPQRPLIHTLDGTPTKAETVKAIRQLQTGKAPGPDGTPPEIFKVVMRHLLSSLSACSSSTVRGGGGGPRKTSRTPTSFICIRTKVKSQVRQPQKHLTSQHCWQAPGPHPPEQDHQTSFWTAFF